MSGKNSQYNIRSFFQHDFSGFCTLFLVMFYLLSIQTCLTQMVISGKIVDDNSEPLPFVHLRFENANLGTVSNEKGEFKLIYIPEIKNNAIVISSVGYLTTKVFLEEGYHVLSLSRDITRLKEVIVVPRDYGKELIINAIKAIPSNYPSDAERHRGFFRETTSWEKNKKPIYVAEAVIEAIKKPYNNQNRLGHVEIIEFRKFESNQSDSLKTKIYAGAHHIHRFDVVARRDAFLGNPNGFKYKIKDTLRQQGKDIYKVYFEKKNKLFGHVYIMDSIFAIVKLDFNDRSFSKLPGKKREYLNYTIAYEQGDDKLWRFKHSQYNTAFKENGELLKLVSNYVTTDVQINETDISYSNRLQFGDILLDESKEYKPNFWNNYNIILSSQESESAFASIDYSQNKQNRKKSNKLINIINNLRLDMMLKWTPYQVGTYALSYSNEDLEIQQNDVFSNRQAWGFSYSLYYKVKSDLFLGYASESRISKSGITSHDIIVLKEFNLNPNGRPISIGGGLKLGYQELNTFLNRYDDTRAFEVKEKSIDSDKIDVFLTQRSYRWQPIIALKIENNHQLSFILSTGYNFQLNEKTGLLFHEKSGFFLSRKKIFLENGNENLVIDYDGDLLKNNFSISAGISYKF